MNKEDVELLGREIEMPMAELLSETLNALPEEALNDALESIRAPRDAAQGPK